MQAAGALRDRGPRRVPPGLTVYGTADAIATVLSRRYGFLGQTHAIATVLPAAAATLDDAQHHELFTGPGFPSSLPGVLRRFYEPLA